MFFHQVCKNTSAGFWSHPAGADGLCYHLIQGNPRQDREIRAGLPAFPVDTHIHRLAQRWGLSNGKNVVQTEADLKAIFAEEHWNALHLQVCPFHSCT
jgi:hypothetical protein